MGNEISTLVRTYLAEQDDLIGLLQDEKHVQTLHLSLSSLKRQEKTILRELIPSLSRTRAITDGPRVRQMQARVQKPTHGKNGASSVRTKQNRRSWPCETQAGQIPRVNDVTRTEGAALQTATVVTRIREVYGQQDRYWVERDMMQHALPSLDSAQTMTRDDTGSEYAMPGKLPPHDSQYDLQQCNEREHTTQEGPIALSQQLLEQYKQWKSCPSAFLRHKGTNIPHDPISYYAFSQQVAAVLEAKTILWRFISWTYAYILEQLSQSKSRSDSAALDFVTGICTSKSNIDQKPKVMDNIKIWAKQGRRYRFFTDAFGGPGCLFVLPLSDENRYRHTLTRVQMAEEVKLLERQGIMKVIRDLDTNDLADQVKKLLLEPFYSVLQTGKNNIQWLAGVPDAALATRAWCGTSSSSPIVRRSEWVSLATSTSHNTHEQNETQIPPALEEGTQAPRTVTRPDIDEVAQLTFLPTLMPWSDAGTYRRHITQCSTTGHSFAADFTAAASLSDPHLLLASTSQECRTVQDPSEPCSIPHSVSASASVADLHTSTANIPKVNPCRQVCPLYRQERSLDGEDNTLAVNSNGVPPVTASQEVHFFNFYVQPTELRVVPDTALSIKLARNGDIDGLRYLFSQGEASPRDVSSSRRYSLLRWVLYGNIHNYEAVQFLIQQGAVVDEELYQHIWDFAYRGKCTAQELRELVCILSNGSGEYAHRQWSDEQKFPAIHDIILGRTEKLRKLLCLGAGGVGAYTYTGWPDGENCPDVHDLILDQSKELLVAELSKAPDAVFYRDAMGRTALDWATASGKVPIMELLLKHFPNVQNTIDVHGRSTMLHAVDSHDTAALAVLLKAGVSPNPEVAGRSSPLNAASFGGLVDMVELLLEYGANVDACNPEGRTALHAAVGVADTAVAKRIVSALLAHGADLHFARHGCSPLSMAIMQNSHDVLNLFCEKCMRKCKVACRRHWQELLPTINDFADTTTVGIITTSGLLDINLIRTSDISEHDKYTRAQVNFS